MSNKPDRVKPTTFFTGFLLVGTVLKINDGTYGLQTIFA